MSRMKQQVGCQQCGWASGPSHCTGRCFNSKPKQMDEKELSIGLKEWVKTYFQSQDQMDVKMGWGAKTASRYLNHQPHRLFEFRHRLAEMTKTDPFELHKMIDQREREILAKQKLRQGKQDAPAMDVLSHSVVEGGDEKSAVQ